MDERRQRRESQYNKYTIRELSTNLTEVRVVIEFDGAFWGRLIQLTLLPFYVCVRYETAATRNNA